MTSWNSAVVMPVPVGLFGLHRKTARVAGVMAATIAVLTLAYGLVVVLLAHFLAERIRASDRATSALNKTAGVLLIGFGLKLALFK